jgi:hypothetical protein
MKTDTVIPDKMSALAYPTDSELYAKLNNIFPKN